MLEVMLGKLADSMNERAFKSNQACFNYYLNELTEAKKYHTWKSITDFLNNKTNKSLSSETYIAMMKRAKIKTSKSITHDKDKSIVKQKDGKEIVAPSKKASNPAELKELRIQSELKINQFIKDNY